MDCRSERFGRHWVFLNTTSVHPGIRDFASSRGGQ
jgi:hypothetical protein